MSIYSLETPSVPETVYKNLTSGPLNNPHRSLLIARQSSYSGNLCDKGEIDGSLVFIIHIPGPSAHPKRGRDANGSPHDIGVNLKINHPKMVVVSRGKAKISPGSGSMSYEIAAFL